MGHIKHVHFIGIGGAGMAGIAEVLLRQGYVISGSDLTENALTQWLKVIGATIYRGHAVPHIKHADVIVYSSAVSADNPELVAARAAHIPIVPRAQMLGELMRFRYGVAISGTHGKTTTTSLLTSILAAADLDPTFVIGGRLNSTGSHARLGKGQYLIAEADESDASFLYLNPMISIVTNIDNDHMETYGHHVERLQKTFIEFIHKLPFYGLAALCVDDPGVREILPQLSRRVLTYGLSEEAHVRTLSYTQQGLRAQFTVIRPQRAPLPVTLNLPGRHNVLNALAAIAVATSLNVDDCAILEALSNFSGIDRRFQIYGEFALQNAVGHVTFVDDYGHHPREIESTLKAVRECWPDRRIVMVYQPHRYTRTHDLMADFAQVLSLPDALLLLDVYSAGEAHIPHADGQSLALAIKTQGVIDPVFVSQQLQLPALLQQTLRDGDILLTQGAGNIGAIAAVLAKTNLAEVVHG